MEINKTPLEECYSLLDTGFSLITVREDKTPNIAWKKYQTKQATKEEFNRNWSMTTTDAVGIVTGFNDIEVIDIDLKVFDSQEKMDAFWNEYLSFLKDNIQNFDSKFIIVKTKNNGFHIIYKCKDIKGNSKIAKLEGMNEAVLESRGVGGYVWVYSDFVLGNGYNDIKEITPEDRAILWSCSEIYNYIKPEEERGGVITSNLLSPWEDYNSKNNIIDVVSGEFSVVRRMNGKTIVKRHGAKSPHSGYIYHNSNCLYLFSTGTIYPAEKLISPFAAFTHKYHGGDFKAAGADLYSQGFGSRASNTEYTKQIISDKVEIIEENECKIIPFPINVFPKFIKGFINEVSQNGGFSKDFLSVSIMSTFASILGQSVELRVNNTWSTAPIFWFCVVGSPGSKKSHPVKFAIRPLKELDKESKVSYDEEMGVYDTFIDMSDKDKKQYTDQHGKIGKPEYKQIIVKDATIEALFYVHNINKRGVLLYKDELIGWINAMGQYKGGKGDEMEKFLSMFDGDELKINRVTKEPLVMDRTCMNLIGTIQPDVVAQIPKTNGLIHRFLFTNADKEIKHFNTNEVSLDSISQYSQIIKDLDSSLTNNKGEVITYEMTAEAKKVFIEIDKFLISVQKSDDTIPIVLEYCEKLKTYTPRFALLIAIMNSMYDSQSYAEVDKKHMESAFELVKYFLNTAKIMFADTKKTKEIKDINSRLNGQTNVDKIIALVNKGVKKVEIMRELDISRTYIYKVISQNKDKIK